MRTFHRITFWDIPHLGFKMLFDFILFHVNYEKSILCKDGTKIKSVILVGNRDLKQRFKLNVPKDRKDFWKLKSYEILYLKGGEDGSLEDVFDKVIATMNLGDTLWAEHSVDVNRNLLMRLNFIEDEKYHFWQFQKGTF